MIRTDLHLAKTRWLLLSAPSAMAMMIGAAQAQDAVPSDPLMLEPLVVTARKLEEDPQNVPLSISAFDSQKLDDKRIDDVETLLRDVPNVGFSSLGDGRSTFLSIRGVGPMSQPLGYDDTSTVTYVDGVPQPLFGSDQRLLDAERIEVMRGPQGTVFGRNAQAGAINITTRQPGDRTEFTARSELGSDWHRLGMLSLSTPIVADKLGMRISALHSAIEGDVANLAPGTGDLGDVQNSAIRATLTGRLGPDTRLTLGVFGQRDRNRPSNFVLKSDSPKVMIDPEGGADRDLAGLSLTAAHDFAGLTATAVTAFNHYGYQQFSNNSEALTFSRVFGMPASAFLPATDFSRIDESQNAFYQEFRLSTRPGAPISWVVGLNYYHDRYSLNSYYESPFFISTNGTRDNSYGTDSYAAFGEATVPVPGLEKLKLTAGLRYTHDDKDYDVRYRTNGFAGTVPSFRQSGSLSYDMVTGRASLGYEVTPSSTLYATVARGAKSGGFPNFTTNATTGQSDKPYEESTSWSYELGSKNRLFGGRGQANVALFLNDVKKQNLNALDSASFTFVPKPLDTRSYGVEAELSYRLLPGLDLSGALGYTRAEIENVSADVAASSGARDGNRVPSTPRFTSSLSLQYRGSASLVGLDDRANVFGLAQHQYVGARAADVGGNFDLDSYQMVNLKLGLEFQHLDVYLFGQNVLDERPQYIGLYYGPGAEAVTVGHGRVLGVGAQVRF